MGGEFVFLLKYKQNMNKDEQEKTKKNEVLSSSSRVCLSLFFAYTSIETKFSPLQNGPLPQCEQRLLPSPSLSQVQHEHKYIQEEES